MNMLFFHSTDLSETLDVDVISSQHETFVDYNLSGVTRFGIRIVGWAVSKNNEPLPKRLPFTTLLKDFHASEYRCGVRSLYFRKP